MTHQSASAGAAAQMSAIRAAADTIIFADFAIIPDRERT